MLIKRKIHILSYVMNECNKDRYLERLYIKVKSQHLDNNETLQLPLLCSSRHPSFCLCRQSRAAVMHVDTVFLVCPLIFGE